MCCDFESKIKNKKNQIKIFIIKYNNIYIDVYIYIYIYILNNYKYKYLS